jgi:hypothetical protein
MGESVSSRRKRLLCPICLTSFGAVSWISEQEGEVTGRPKISACANWLRRLIRKPSGRDRIAHGAGKAYLGWKQKAPHPTCPNQHVLPPDFDRRDTVVVGLVGEKGSSKSHYLAALVTTLVEEGPLTRFGITVGISPESERVFREQYYEPLFIHHSQLEGTLPLYDVEEVRQPLVLELLNFQTNTYTNLVIFDAAGEQLNTDVDQARYSGFLLATDIVMLFVTPDSLRGLRSYTGAGTDALQNVISTKSMFEQLATQLRHARGLDTIDPLDDVIGTVLLAKADLLSDIPRFREDLLREPSYEEVTSKSTLARIEDESDWISQLLENHGGRDLVASLTARYQGCSFHSVSATGCSAVNGKFDEIKPFRCLDPLLYGLIKLGVISKER